MSLIPNGGVTFGAGDRVHFPRCVQIQNSDANTYDEIGPYGNSLQSDESGGDDSDICERIIPRREESGADEAAAVLPEVG